MITITITVEGDDARKLAELANALEQERDDVLTSIGTELVGYIGENFETKSQGKPGEDGATWAPLKPATIKRKAKRNRRKGGLASTLIGIDTGMLRGSINPGFRPSDGKGGNVLKIEGDQVTVGYGRNYAPYFDGKRKLLPDEIPDEWRQVAEEVLKDWIEAQWARRMT